MWSIRYFDELVDLISSRRSIHVTSLLQGGQEAVAVGACAVLRADDKITSTHRGHGHCIAKGADVNRMMSELFGKSNGYCKGKGGSMHIADLEKGNLGANGIVGGGIPIAVGAALTSKMKDLGYVVLCFFGDGAANEGSFHESLNLAAIWDLPVVFLCENNQYGMSGSVKDMFRIENIADRAAGYGMPGRVVDGNDIFQVMSAVDEAVRRARSGKGPTLLEAKTYRWKGHSKSDAKKYRSREEERWWRENRDPIRRMEEVLLAEGIFTRDEAEEMRRSAARSIEEAVTFAEKSPMPSLDTLEEDVYA